MHKGKQYNRERELVGRGDGEQIGGFESGREDERQLRGSRRAADWRNGY